MIKITKALYQSDLFIELYFSDGKKGVYDAAKLVGRDTEMVTPLKNIDYFQTFFLELGALCWKNGLEISASSLYLKLRDKHLLVDVKDQAA